MKNKILSFLLAATVVVTPVGCSEEYTEPETQIRRQETTEQLCTETVESHICPYCGQDYN